MEQIINLISKIADNSQSIGLILSIAILGIVFIGILYLKTLRKAAKNDYHTLPEHTEAIRDELKMLRMESNLAHSKTNELLNRIDGRLSK